MASIYKGEFQDYEGNVVYPHTSADVVFSTDGETIQKKISDAGIDYSTIKAQLTSGSDEFKFGVTSDGQYGYHKKVDGADTVIPFKTGGSVYGCAMGQSLTFLPTKDLNKLELNIYRCDAHYSGYKYESTYLLGFKNESIEGIKWNTSKTYSFENAELIHEYDNVTNGYIDLSAYLDVYNFIGVEGYMGGSKNFFELRYS